MKLNRILVFLSLLGAALLLSCASEPTKTSAPDTAKPAEKKEVALYTGRPCLERMSYMALRWQADALPYHLESEANAEGTGQDGKSTVWKANFISASRNLAKTFTCSGSLLKDSPPYGVTSNREFSSSAAAITTFTSAALVVDSDAAAKLALDHGGADLIKRDPKQPVYYELGVDAKSNKLVWAAVFGTSPKENKGIGLIDATYPKFIGALKH
jgi:hypothetical protein